MFACTLCFLHATLRACACFEGYHPNKSHVGVNGMSSDVVVVDVRRQDELAVGVVDRAVNIPYGFPDFNLRLQELQLRHHRNTTFVVYCQSGTRSEAAVSQMRACGMRAYNAGSLEQASVRLGRRIVSSQRAHETARG